MDVGDARIDLGLITAAVAICGVASFGVQRIRARILGASGRVRDVWLFLAGVEAGAGVWGAQLLVMLAADAGAPAAYDPFAMLGGLLLAVSGSTLALGVAWLKRDRLAQGTGGALFGATAAAVHYACVYGRHVPARLDWEPIMVWLSIMAALGLSIASVLASRRGRSLAAQLTAAALLTAAVVALQALAWAACRLAPVAVPMPADFLNHTAMLFFAVMLTALMIAAGMGAAFIDDNASRRAAQRLQRLADATHDGIAVLAADRRVVDCNAAFASLCKRRHAEVLGRTLDDLLTLDEAAEPLRLDQRREGAMLGPDGATTPVAVKLSFMADHGDAGRPGLIATVADLREQRAAEARVRFLNEHDPVTGLPNRAVLTARLEEAAASALATSDRGVMLVAVRVGNSQEVNALHGHAAGDALLAKVGERLTRIVGGDGVAARMGGNEFAFFTPCARVDANDTDGRAFFGKVMPVLRRPFVWNSLALEPQVRLGVAALPHDSVTVETLLAHADSALQGGEEEAVDGVAYFRKDLHDALTAQRALAHDLRNAIAADELTVFYQPQVRAADGELCGFEALVRWKHPEFGFLPPDRFIGVAESSGLISLLGEWVLRRACLDAAGWRKPVPVAVNLSPLQVGETDLPKRVHEILLETGLSPSRLELEITESALFRDYQRALDVLRRLKALGIRIAMDDFGTGFSSLSTLQSFPFDKIKIDKGFVEGVGTLERSTVIVRAVLGIGRGLAIPVVAEGVETSAQAGFLRDEQCDVVQGYLIGKPGPVDLHSALFDAAARLTPEAPDTPTAQPAGIEVRAA